MVTNDLHIKDVAIVMSSDRFCELIHSKKILINDRYIYIPRKFEYGKTFFFEQKSEPIEKGFVVIAKPNIQIQFISFILNSLVSALTICDGSLSKLARMSINKIENISVKRCNDVRMHSLGYSNRIVQFILMQNKIYPNNEKLRFYYNLFSEIRDGMSIELLVSPLFEKYNIHIIEEWENILIKYDFNPNTSQLVESLMKDDNEVMNQIRKMRSLITNIGSVILDERKNELENK